MRILVALGLAAAVSACATSEPAQTGPAAPGAEFIAAANQVMVFAPTAQVLGEGRGYTALVYRGLRAPQAARRP